MKAKLCLSLFFACTLFWSCDDDLNVTDEYKDRFSTMYPDAQRVEWEKKGSYYVAEFWRKDVNAEAEAWFNKQAHWAMTVTEIAYGALPEEVKSGFQSSEYSRWRLDDTDKVERSEKGTIYVIEVEEGKKEYELYFTADGALLKAIPDTNGSEHTHYME